MPNQSAISLVVQPRQANLYTSSGGMHFLLGLRPTMRPSLVTVPHCGFCLGRNSHFTGAACSGGWASISWVSSEVGVVARVNIYLLMTRTVRSGVTQAVTKVLLVECCTRTTLSLRQKGINHILTTYQQRFEEQQNDFPIQDY